MILKDVKIRTSQGISTFGVGAIVDFRDASLMAGSIKYWNLNNTIEIFDERLAQMLHVKKFLAPKPTSNKEPIDGFPFVLFPEWYFCPSCRSFKEIWKWEEEFRKRNKYKWEMETPLCSTCGVKLVPARILSVCKHGHIQDFPWVAWTHYKDKKTICESPNLKITTVGSTSGLEGIKVQCENCKAKTTLKGAFNKGVYEEIIDNLTQQNKLLYASHFKCKGNLPWEKEEEICKSPNDLITVQRGANNVYYSKIISSIVIPPYSNSITKKIENNSTFKHIQSSLDFGDYNLGEYVTSDKFSSHIERIRSEISSKGYLYPLCDVKEVVLRKIAPNEIDSNDFDEQKYRVQEYKALIGEIIPEGTDNDFVIEEMKTELYELDFLSKVTLIKKMREVRALIGFTRIYPPDRMYISFDDESKEASLINIRSNNEDWFPAYQVKGEGIFIELNKEILDSWATKVSVLKRVSIIEKSSDIFTKSRNLDERKIDPQFVLLHTLAHLIIKQLSFESGYSSAALREKIYFSDSDYSMNGILIYTASGDSEGSLGGLVRQGEERYLPRLILKALSDAQWCSNDPVCIESNGQGSNSLNLSACYACSLISETSCEEFNVYLDRGLLIGTLDDRDLGFFSKYLNG